MKFLLLLFIFLKAFYCTSPPHWDERLKEDYDKIPCGDESDCLFLGECVNGACFCQPGFKGSHCHELNLLPTHHTWGFYDETRHSWGGTIVRHDGEYHLFVSFIERNCDLAAYGTNSAVLRATSIVPQGPYIYQETILPPFHHGATAFKDENTGEIFLWTDGVNTPNRTIHNCILREDSKKMPLQRINSKVHTGLYAYGKSPHDFLTVSYTSDLKTWTKNQIITRTNLTAEAACNRTNPSPVIMEDGTLRIALRTKWCQGDDAPNCKNFLQNCEHIYFINLRLQTPLENDTSKWKLIHQLEGAEDPFMWKDSKGRFHILAHSKRACGTSKSMVERCSILAGSLNGDSWESGHRRAFKGTVDYLDGTMRILYLAQRPKILFAEDGETPLFLILGVRVREESPIHTMLIPFNVSANAHLIVERNISENHESELQNYEDSFYSAEKTANTKENEAFDMGEENSEKEDDTLTEQEEGDDDEDKFEMASNTGLSQILEINYIFQAIVALTVIFLVVCFLLIFQRKLNHYHAVSQTIDF